MLKRTTSLFLGLSLLATPLQSAWAQSTPSSKQIYKQLNRAAPARAAKDRVGVRELKRNKRLRHSLPSVNINSINFQFGSARIPPSQSWKVRNIADAMLRFRRGRPERFLIEGHTDAIGSRHNNQRLSEQRARSLKRALTNWFGVPRRMLITVGYGEDNLLIPTRREEWRNRRVTLRRVTGVLR
ncbi:MAG: OmpA family protein [Rhizobiaceae bacterium]